jgi:hypothetical protein
MEYLNWMAEHWILTWFLGVTLVGVAHGLGPKGTKILKTSKDD